MVLHARGTLQHGAFGVRYAAAALCRLAIVALVSVPALAAISAAVAAQRLLHHPLAVGLAGATPVPAATACGALTVGTALSGVFRVRPAAAVQAVAAGGPRL